LTYGNCHKAPFALLREQRAFDTAELPHVVATRNGLFALRSQCLTILFMICSLSATDASAQNWYNTSWLYRKKVTVDYTKVGATGAPHASFPVLVSITDANLSGNAQSDADDILFTSSDGTTKIDHELESYTSASGVLVAWVEVPSLSASSNTVIYMYYGNASATNQQNVTGTWNSNYKGVWHLNASYLDATSNNNDGTNTGTTSATGKISGARGFVRSNGADYITISGKLGSPADITLSAWAYLSSPDGSGSEVISIGDYVALRMDLTTDGTEGFTYNGSDWSVTTSSSSHAGAWHHLVYTFSDAGNSQKLYADGTQIASSTYTGSISYSGLGTNTYIGKHGNGGTNMDFDGTIDEVRVSNTARSAGWILTEYRNQNSPSTFYSVGSQQQMKTWDGGAGTDNWGDANNWNPNGVPTSSDFVSLTGANTIDVDVAGACNDIVVNNAGLVVTVKASQSLTVSGALTLTTGSLKTENAFPAVTGTVDLSGGTIEYSASSGSQTVSALTYNNLTISGGGTKTLAGNCAIGGNLTVNGGTLALSTYTASRSSSGGTLSVAAGAALKISGTGSFPSNYTTNTLNATSTVEYAGTAQTISNQAYGHLTLSGSGTKTMPGTSMIVAGDLTLSGTCSATLGAAVTISGNLSIGSGTTFTLSSYTCNRATSGGTLTVSSGGTLKVGGTNGIPSNYATHSIGSTSTTELNGSSQTVAVLNSSQQYGNLTLSGSGTKTLGGSITVRGALSLSGATLADGGYTLSANGNIGNSSSHTGSGKIALTGGSASHTLSGGGSYANLEINDSYGATLSATTTVNGTLTFTSGKITTGAYTLVVSSTGSVSRTSGHVVGTCQKYVGTGATSRTFEIGDATTYAPIDVAFASVTVAGNLSASTTAGSHPNANLSPIDEDKNVNRYWTLTNSGITFTNYSATCTFVSGDLDAGANTTLFIVGRYSSSTWSSPTVGTRTSTTTQATGLTGFGDFEIGEPFLVSTQTGIAVTSLTWSHTVSNLANRVLIVGITAEDGSTIQASSVTYNGTNLTQIASRSAGTSTYQNVSLWYLLAPSVGTANVVVTWSATMDQATAGSFVLYGIAQIAPEASGSSYSNSGATSTNITTVADSSYVVDMFGSGQDQGDLAPGSGQTQRFINAAGSTTSGGGSTKIVGTAGTITMSWTQTGINRSAHVVASFAPAVFYSKGSLDVSTASNWNTRRDGTGTNASSFSTDVRWIVQNSHSVTLSGSTSWNVGAGGILTIESGGTWTNTSSGTVTLGALWVDNGGTYSHGTSNSLPGTTKSLGATSTVVYNGSSQTVEALTYGHLTFTSSGTRTLGGNATIAGNLTASGGTFDLSSYTANRASSGGTFTVSSGVTLKIGGTNSFPANYSTVSLGSTSTAEYNGSAQTVASQTYGHLTLSNGNTKTAADVVTVGGDLTIAATTTFAAGDFAHVMQGNWSNSGMFNAGSGSITLSGNTSSQITGTTAFNALVVNKLSGVNSITLNSAISTATLTMTQGILVAGSSGITITSDRTGNGIITGLITRTHTFSPGTSYAFEGPNNTMTFASGGTLPTSVSVNVVLSSPGTNTYMDPIGRYYDISQSGGSGFTYTLRLHYEDSEVSSPNSESSPPLKIWRRTGIGPDVWTREGATGSNTTDNWVELTDLTNAGVYSLSSRTVPNMTLTLSQSADNPSPGDEVTYTISYSNTGDGSSTTTIITASAPTHTSYVAGSTMINASAKTDASDADEVTVSGGNISITLGTVGAGVSGTVVYRVQIN
jgi:uncharacterized repeat protein (TIGR01451 family)